MPALEPHEELKLAWDLELMSVTIDKTRLDMEESRKRFDRDMEQSRKRFDLDMEDARKRWDKHIEDRALDEKRFVTQVAGIVIAAIGVVVAAFAAGAIWWNYSHTH